MKRLILISILSIISVAGLKAQERKGPSAEMFEKIKAEKISFFTSKLDLTPSEAQVFWPIYNEFEKKRLEIQRQSHNFERMPNEKFASLSESEIDHVMNEYIDKFEKEASLIKEYNKKFLKILPKKKVLMIYRTENDFRFHLIKDFRKGQRRE